MKFSLKIVLVSCIVSCSFKISNSPKEDQKRSLSEEFKSYWFHQGAEISVYDLNQVRYGENRQGKAVFIFVTEPFHSEKLVKADHHQKENVSVLKLNYIKKFETGVYDYSMMTSSFFPLESGSNSLKVTSSSQEWCGHTFMQLLNRKQFDIQLHSYFESEGEQTLKLKKGFLEDDVFSQIRIDENLLPTGKIEMLPSSFFLRLKHVEITYQKAEAKIGSRSDSIAYYQLYYPDLKRTLQIEYQKYFPHQILSWSESYPESWTDHSNIMTTTGTLRKTKRLKYWEQNKNSDSLLRHELDLN